MRYGKIIVCFLTIVFLCVAVFFWQQDPAQEETLDLDSLFSVLILVDGRVEEIDCWYKWTETDGTQFFVVLPSYAVFSQGTIRVNTSNFISIDDKRLENGMSCDMFELDTIYKLTYSVQDITYHFEIQFLQSGSVPTLHIDVQSGTMDYIHKKKGNEESGWIRLYNAEGELEHAGRVERINGRGNSTWYQLKKPYSLTLATEVDLLGMGQAQKWILLADAMDPSHLRNKIAYDFAGAAGMAYSPGSEWVDLYLNGEYAGLYLLCERNEVHPQRVDISEEGSFLVSRESGVRLETQAIPFISTPSGADLRIHYSGITQKALARVWKSVDNAIGAEDGIDQETGKSWTELINLDSWVTEYLMGEVFGNVDAGSISEYFYCDGNDETGKICAGPVWDFDLSMGNSETGKSGFINVFFGNKAHIWSLEDAPWSYALYQKEEFYTQMTERFQTVFLPLLTQLLDGGLDQYAAQIRQAAAMDQLRWSTTDAAAETEYIRTYMTERIAFLNSVWIQNEEYCTVLAINYGGTTSTCFAIRPGEQVPELPGYEENGEVLGWYYVETDEPFDAAQPIYEDTMIYLKPANSEADHISPFQAVPIAVVILFLTAAFFVDRARAKRNDTQRHE